MLSPLAALRRCPHVFTNPLHIDRVLHRPVKVDVYPLIASMNCSTGSVDKAIEIAMFDALA